MKKMNNKGFTLMEVLIVVAIIAVLIAIAIPVFGNQLEKAREAVDAANLRSAYAEASIVH
jgi:prepilin-type N-terminal cleavage/methylation domain-containing protein